MLWKEELPLGRAKKKKVAKRKKRMFTRNAIRAKMGKPFFFTLTHCNKKMSGISNKYNYKANMHKICFVGARFYNVKYQASIMTDCNYRDASIRGGMSMISNILTVLSFVVLLLSSIIDCNFLSRLLGVSSK